MLFASYYLPAITTVDGQLKTSGCVCVHAQLQSQRYLSRNSGAFPVQLTAKNPCLPDKTWFFGKKLSYLRPTFIYLRSNCIWMHFKDIIIQAPNGRFYGFQISSKRVELYQNQEVNSDMHTSVRVFILSYISRRCLIGSAKTVTNKSCMYILMNNT